jgi:Ni/Co efflux regulator RcnB
MNKLRSLFVAGTALVLSLGTAAVAQAQYYPPPSPGYWHHHHHWHVGERYYGPRHIIVHWRYHHLPPPPYGYVWVQAGPQVLLIGPDGRIAREW